MQSQGIIDGTGIMNIAEILIKTWYYDDKEHAQDTLQGFANGKDGKRVEVKVAGTETTT